MNKFITQQSAEFAFNAKQDILRLESSLFHIPYILG